MIRSWLVPALAALLLMPGPRAGDFEFEDDVPVPLPDTFIITALQPLAAAPAGGMVFARLDIDEDGGQSVSIRGLALPEGEYEVLLNTGPLGVLPIDETGSGEFLPEPPRFDEFFSWFAWPYSLTVRQGGTPLFSALLDTPGGNVLLDDEVSCTNGVRLVAVGEDLDARGEVTFKSSFGRERATLVLERLDPGAYVLESHGQPELLIDIGASGAVTLKLETPLIAGRGRLSLPLVGEVVRLLRDGEPVLVAQLPYDPFEELSQAAGKQKLKSAGKGAVDGLRADFLRSGATGDGPWAGSLQWQRDAAGAVALTVKLQKQDFIPSPPYQLFVDGQLLADLEMDPFASLTSVVPIDPLTNPVVDLRGKRVEVRYQGDDGIALYFPRSVPAALRSYRPEVRKEKLVRLDLLNPGVDLDATGRVTWKALADGERLDVQVKDLPAGSYDLLLGGEVAAAGALVVAEDGGSAKVVLSSTGKPASALPLDVEVAGLLAIVPAGATEPVLLQQDLGDP
jgi:hypothetical protein